MFEKAFAHDFVCDLAARCLAATSWRELENESGGFQLKFHSAADRQQSAGYLRLWQAADNSAWDRMVQVRLQSESVDTNLFFLFALAGSICPHFHGQAVQFGTDNCVYNADLLPRLDPVDHPGYYRLVFEPLSRAYWEATQRPENACASAPGNPAIAAFLSPWSIGAGRPTDSAELSRLTPQLFAYLDHSLALGEKLDYPAPDAELMRARDQRHLHSFFDESLDRRAWKGVYRIIGDEQGHAMRQILMQNLRQ